MNIQMREGVAIDPKDRGKYPFDRLSVGSSFLVEVDPTEKKGKRAAVIRACASRYAASHEGVKFVVRVEPGGVAVGRIS